MDTGRFYDMERRTAEQIIDDLRNLRDVAVRARIEGQEVDLAVKTLGDSMRSPIYLEFQEGSADAHVLERDGIENRIENASEVALIEWEDSRWARGQ